LAACVDSVNRGVPAWAANNSLMIIKMVAASSMLPSGEIMQ